MNLRILKGKHLNALSVLFIFSISVYLICTIPRLLSYGMFLDGQIYSSISRNLAEGFGTFWKLYYIETLPIFCEHPPFAFYLQSLIFMLFGEAYYIEAVYSSLLGLLTIVIIALIWHQLKFKDESLSGIWFPILLFVTIPMISWVYSNNMLENTMTVVVLLSSLFIILSIKSNKLPNVILFAALAGISIFCGFLSKGLNGIFPLVLPIIWWLIFRDISIKNLAIITFTILISLFLCTFIIIINNPSAVSFFENYLNQQLFRSLKGQRETSSRLLFLKILFFESLVPWIVCTIVYIWKKEKFHFKSNKMFLFLIFVGLSGSLPLLISPKQMWWYIIPAFPFFIMAYAALFKNSAKRVEQEVQSKTKLKRTILIIASLLILISFITMFLEKGVVRKNKIFCNDFIVQTYHFEERSLITIYPAHLRKNWGLVSALQRYFKVSATTEMNQELLITSTKYEKDSILTNNYVKVHPPQSMGFVLFKKKNKKRLLKLEQTNRHN